MRKSYGFIAAILVLIANYFLPISIEWKLAAFLVALVLFLIFRVDSRFFIVAALLHLGAAPFALAIKAQPVAETTAIYAYYYLAIGVLGMIIEQWREPELTFESVMHPVVKHAVWNLIAAVTAIDLLIMYFFTDNTPIAVLWYVEIVALIMIAARWLELDIKQSTPAKSSAKRVAKRKK